MSWTAVNWNNNIVYNFVLSLNFFVLWLLSDITVHYCSLDAGKLKLNTAYNCSVELTGKLNSLSFVINIFLSITCTAENPPGTKTATLGSFSNDRQNNNSVHASRFFVRFFAVVERLRRETAQLHVLLRTWAEDNDFTFLFLNFDSLLEVNSRKISQHLTNSTAMECRRCFSSLLS